jgi:hypothetical protein
MMPPTHRFRSPLAPKAEELLRMREQIDPAGELPPAKQPTPSPLLTWHTRVTKRMPMGRGTCDRLHERRFSRYRIAAAIAF